MAMKLSPNIGASFTIVSIKLLVSLGPILGLFITGTTILE